MLKQLTCKKCGHSWLPRVSDVKECPRCKNRNWDGGIKDDCPE